MKISGREFAVLGGSPFFSEPLPVGQINMPDWHRFEASFRGIFSRRYYTNHGPLAQELEARLADFLGVRHVVCMANATIGLIIAAKALNLTGKVIVPSYTFVATVQSLTWAGLEPVFCDVDADTHHITARLVEPLITEEVRAILGVHLWGRPCDPLDLQNLASRNDLRIYFDAAQAFGCGLGEKRLGGLGDLEVFSFHATKILNSAEGGCVCTNDDEIAARLRNMRSSYGAGRIVDVPLTGNGRMSEAQAAMALLSLEDYPANQRRNQDFWNLYAGLLKDIPGIRFQELDRDGASNFQYVVVEIDESEFGLSRDMLVQVLQAENVIARRYFTPGVHRSYFYKEAYPQYLDSLPNTDQLCDRVMQLPSGQRVTPEDIVSVCRLIELSHKNAQHLKGALLKSI